MENISTTDVISIFATVATWITAMLVLLSIREMSKQRKTSYKPEIVPTRQSIHGTKMSLKTVKVPIHWTTRGQKELKEGFPFNNYPITLYNVGNGTAKNLTCEWHFDVDEAIKIINTINKKYLQKLYLECSKGTMMISLKTKTDTMYSISLNLDAIYSYDHLLPVSIDRNGLQIHLPSSYILVMSTFYQLSSLAAGIKNIHLHPSILPDITLNISYEDIGGEKIRKSYKFFILLNTLTNVNNEDKVCVFIATLNYK
jgi:hypothetical protein